MIVEHRTYTMVPGGAVEWLKTYEKEGFPIQLPILGNLVGYFSTEIGPLNQVIHMWAYDDLMERTKRRAKLQADPTWQAYVKKVRPLLVSMETKILIPAPFSPYA